MFVVINNSYQLVNSLLHHDTRSRLQMTNYVSSTCHVQNLTELTATTNTTKIQNYSEPNNAIPWGWSWKSVIMFGQKVQFD